MINGYRVAIFIWTAVLVNYQPVRASDKKGCHLNDVLIHERIFPYFSCWKCYESFKLSGRLVKVNCKIQLDDENYSVPGFVIDEDCVPFDYRTKSISKLVQSSLPNATFELWRRCCSHAVECCETMIKNYQVENFFNTCDNHWDGKSCYRDTFPEKTVKKLCPYQITKSDASKCQHSYSKECLKNGNWSTPNYSQCFPNKRLQSHLMSHIIILSMSLLFCVPPMLIFLIKKEVRSKSLSSIVVLISIIGLRNIFIVSTKSIIFIEPSVLYQNLWLCKVTTILAMFIESLAYTYLLTITLSMKDIVINAIERSYKKVFLLGLIAAIILTVAWTVTMQFTSDSYCWQLSLTQYPHWINDWPRFAALLFTIYNFVKILRSQSGPIKVHDTANDAIFTSQLITLTLPFFLLPFVLMMIDLCYNTCGWEELNKFLFTICDALQLIILAFIFFLIRGPREFIRDLWKRRFFRHEISSQDSEASLAPSRISRNSLTKEDISEPINSWNEFVIRARSSICEGNIYTNGPHAISSSPDPPSMKNRISLICRPSTIQPEATRRHTIRDIMWRAKNNLPKNGQPALPAKCVTPPLPKNIPNQILDDVQLFDFYYKNLNSIYINEATPNIQTCIESDDSDGHASVKRISRMLSFGSDKAESLKKLSQLTSDDEQSVVSSEGKMPVPYF